MSRFGVDVSNVGRGFQDLVQSWNLVGEQNRMQREREAQQQQAMLSLLAAAGGAFIPGVSAVAGAQMGLGAAQLLGPRPNVGAGAQMLLGGADRMQRDEQLGKFGKALNPADRGAAAQAAANLGDIGTAAGLAFPPGQGGREPNLFNVRIPDKAEDSGFKVLSGVTLADAMAARDENPGSIVSKVGSSMPSAESAATASEKAPTTRTIKRLLPLEGEPEGEKVPHEVTQEWQRNEKGKGSWVEVGSIPIAPKGGKGEGGGGGSARTSTNAVDLVEIQVKAAQQVARKSGKQDVLKAMAESGTNVEALQKVGALSQRDIEKEYMNLLEAETKSRKPETERDVAQAELDLLDKQVKERTKEIKLAKSELALAAGKAERDRIIKMALSRGLIMSDLGLSGLGGE